MGGRSVLTGQRMLIGVGAIVSSVLYVASDLIELAAGRLSTGQLVITYLAEALIPFFILGLHSVQQPRGGWLSLLGALLYGFAFVGSPPRSSIRW